MPYVRLPLSNTKVSAAISMATEQHLQQAHYLLAATYPNGGPHNHFGMSAAVMTLLTIAAASAVRYFDPKTNKKKKRDRDAFTECVSKFFPWDHVKIEDDQCRSLSERQKAAVAELYCVFRNPLVHSGGVTSKPYLSGTIGNWYRTPRIVHVFPGLASPQENERAVADYCAAETLSGDILIKLEAFTSTVYTRPLYWCTRKMIEAFAADRDVQRDVADGTEHPPKGHAERVDY